MNIEDTDRVAMRRASAASRPPSALGEVLDAVKCGTLVVPVLGLDLRVVG